MVNIRVFPASLQDRRGASTATGTPARRYRVEFAAGSTGRSRAFLAAEAISAYLDTNEWQVA